MITHEILKKIKRNNYPSFSFITECSDYEDYGSKKIGIAVNVNYVDSDKSKRYLINKECGTVEELCEQVKLILIKELS